MSSINHPQHYNMGGPIGPDGSAEFEVIKIIEDLGWGFEFCMSNALKYVLRAPHKGDESSDLQKARWYLERAQRHHGSVRALCFRKINVNDAAVAWGLTKDSRLAMTVSCISEGNPFEALGELNVYMVKFGAGVGDGGATNPKR